MSINTTHLLKTRRFLPLFITQFLGAFNDNLYRTALVTLVTYKMADITDGEKSLLVTMALGLFILPFFLFSATAGQIADKVNKARLIQIVKFSEILIMGLAVIGFGLNNPYFLMVVLFLMGTHSAFFGPVKYSILPDQLREDELIGGNGLIEAGTFLAILLGTMLGGFLMKGDNAGLNVISPAVMGIAVLGFVASLFINKTKSADKNIKIELNIAKSTIATMRSAHENGRIVLAILGISWFWLLGGIFMSQMPSFTKDVLHADQAVFTLLLTMFSLGIGLGSILCNKLLRGEISSKYVPISALLMTIFIWDIASVSSSLPHSENLISLKEFFADFTGWRISADLLLFSLCGGIYIVPLYALMQSKSEVSQRSRVIAANNIINALFMVISSIAAMALLSSGTSIPGLFKIIAITNLFVAIYIRKILPKNNL